jgi:uncharacterized protein with HEPN domain
MLEAAKLASEYLGDFPFSGFAQDVRTQDAVMRRLEILGEAAQRVSQRTKDGLPDFPWTTIRDLRNALAHEYDNIDLVDIWETLKFDLPGLIANLEQILGRE